MSNRESATENWLHKTIESWLHLKIPDREISGLNTLELGAGTLNHLIYENVNSKIYDIVEPKKFLYEESKFKNKVAKAHQNFEDTPENFYDRIISIAVLEHLEDLPWFLAKSSFKLKSLGYHSHSVPCEGYPTWNISWSASRALPFYLKTGQSYKKIQKHEHINNLDEIFSLINYFYKDVSIKYSYPFFVAPSVALFANITFCKPNRENINKYLKRFKSKKT